MEMNWRRVAVSLNGDGHRDLDLALKQESPDAAQEYRIRGFTLISIANALFDGLGEGADPGRQ
jgi:hypothetical protein